MIVTVEEFNKIHYAIVDFENAIQGIEYTDKEAFKIYKEEITAVRKLLDDCDIDE